MSDDPLAVKDMSDDLLFFRKMSNDPLKCGPTSSYALFMTTPLGYFYYFFSIYCTKGGS